MVLQTVSQEPCLDPLGRMTFWLLIIIYLKLGKAGMNIRDLSSFCGSLELRHEEKGMSSAPGGCPGPEYIPLLLGLGLPGPRASFDSAAAWP